MSGRLWVVEMEQEDGSWIPFDADNTRKESAKEAMEFFRADLGYAFRLRAYVREESSDD